MNALVIVGIILLFAIGAISFTVGFRRGRNVGWLEHYFHMVDRDRARRDKRGRFVAIKGKERTIA